MLRYLVCGGIASILSYSAYDVWPPLPERLPAGVLAPGEPRQVMIEPRELGMRGGYRLTAVAEYAISGRVLATRRYGADRGSTLAPLDVAVGWGPMSDRAVLERIQLSQQSRFFFYEWRGTPPIPREEIWRHAASMHVIPANGEVAVALPRLRVGQVVSMDGWLVNARSATETWKTSLRRDDTGAGACEIFYVQSLSAGAIEAQPARALATAQ